MTPYPLYENKFKSFKWERTAGAQLIGKYDFPLLLPVHDAAPRNFVPFHLLKSCTNQEESWFHFYEDDFQFERFWNNPSQYLNILSKFEGGIGPDYSMYYDMPKSQQIWNCWRNRVMTYYLQQKGFNVIPNVCWGDMESLDWAFDGIPENSVLAITTQGCMKNDYVAKHILLCGLHKLIRDKHPEKIIVYGRFPEIWKTKFSIPIVVIPTFCQQKWGNANGKR